MIWSGQIGKFWSFIGLLEKLKKTRVYTGKFCDLQIRLKGVSNKNYPSIFLLYQIGYFFLFF